MSGVRAQVAADDDDDDIPLRPAGGGQQNGASDDQQDEQRPIQHGFEVVRTDDNFQPLDRESALDEDNEGEGTLLERRRASERDGQDHAQERINSSPDQRRQTRRNSRQRARDARDRNLAYTSQLEQELQELRGMVQGIAPRLDAHDRARMQDQLQGLTGAIETQEAIAAAAKSRMIDAMESGDHKAVADAMDQRDAAVREGARLAGLKTQAEQNFQRAEVSEGDEGQRQGSRPQPRQDNRQQPNRLSPQAQDHSNAFFERHGWINRRNLKDPETVEVLALDQLVASRGFRADTQEYWDAIEDEMRSSPVLAHRFDDDDGAQQQNRSNGRETTRQQPAQQQRRGPMVGGGTERPARTNGQASNGKVYLSPGRLDALQRANVIDSRGDVVDPEKYARVLKSIQSYDRDNSPSRS